jgi:transposase
MSERHDLRALSKNELIELYLEERDARLALQARLEKVEHYLKAFDNAHTPSSKKLKRNTQKESDPKKPRFPGKPPGANGGGIKLPEIDEVVEHKLEADPKTGQPLGKPIGFYRKIIIDFPDKPIRIVEHRIMKYRLPDGRTVCKDVDLPKGIYGRNLKSIVVLLKNLTNSHEKIAALLRELGAPSFSHAEVQAIANEYTQMLKPERKKLLMKLRKAIYLHSDETSFRKDGQNGYVWGVFSEQIAIFCAAMSRGRKIIKKLLGKFSGVIVTDGYVAYDDFKLRQRCWAHLLREFKEFSWHPEIKVQYLRLIALYERMKILKAKPPTEDDIAAVAWMLNDIVTCLKTIKDARALVTLVENGGQHWFTAMHHPNVPFDNNLAERELRQVVLLRKTIGCYRNQKGKDWIDIVMSVLHSWALQGRNLFQGLRALPA